MAPVQDAGETTAEAPEIAEADEADQPEADAPPQTDIATETDEDEATETDAVAEAEPATPTVPDPAPTTDEATASARVGDGRPYLVGRVLDAGSGQPLPDVAVRLTLAGGEALETPQSATSDPRGRYHFDVPGGVAQVELSRTDYLPATRRLEVPADRVIRAIDATIGQAVRTAECRSASGCDADGCGRSAAVHGAAGDFRRDHTTVADGARHPGVASDPAGRLVTAGGRACRRAGRSDASGSVRAQFRWIPVRDRIRRSLGSRRQCLGSCREHRDGGCDAGAVGSDDHLRAGAAGPGATGAVEPRAG